MNIFKKIIKMTTTSASLLQYRIIVIFVQLFSDHNLKIDFKKFAKVDSCMGLNKGRVKLLKFSVAPLILYLKI